MPKDLRESSDRVFMDALVGIPDPIERQEKRGQDLLCESGVIPRKLEPSLEAWTKLGFKVNGGDDPLFYEATFPKGWTIKATDHSMWSDVLDERGAKRGSVFYKAAFYDRSATGHLSCKYRVECDHSKRDSENKVFANVVNGQTKAVLFQTFTLKHPKGYFDIEPGMKECREWLDKNKPEWKDVAVYWDEE